MSLSGNLLVPRNRSLPFKGALLSSGVMAFAGLGDALLYPVLPIYGERLGFSVVFVGVLLSVNRFVRILTNTPIANLVHRFGMKKVLVVCSVMSVVTTAIYGLEWGAMTFLMARIAWGLSYSGLKMATLNYAAGVKKWSGLAFGVSNGIKAMGVFFALWIGPILIDNLGFNSGVGLIAMISALGFFLAVLLPARETFTNGSKVQTRKTFHPSPVNLLVFIFSLGIDGILVVGLAYLFQTGEVNTTGLLVTVSSYLLLKKSFVLIFSFLSGWMTLRVPVQKLFYLSAAFCIIGTLLISMDYAIAGLVIAFLFNTIIVTFSPLIAIESQPEKEGSLQAISGVSTWWDLGAAVGAFIGIYCIERFGVQEVFLLLSTIMMLLFINFMIDNANTNRATV